MADTPSCRIGDSHKFRPAYGLKTRAKGDAIRPPVLPAREVVIPPRGWPTAYLGGSAEKCRVFAARQARREPLFHPFDAKWCGCVLPRLFALLSEADRKAIIAECGYAPEPVVVQAEEPP